MAQKLSPEEAATQELGPEETYEAARVEAVLAEQGLRQAATPEGKRIAFIRIVRKDVFQPGEVFVDWIVWFNHFHFLTDEKTVRRELRLAEGQPYSAALAAETARNLRSLGIFSLVRVVPVKTDDPNQVGVLVYTRDLWSLRWETEPQITDTSFELKTQITERNLFGQNKAATARLDIRPLSFSVGQRYVDYRLGDAGLSLVESGDVVFNSETGTPEGTFGRLSLGRPFYNLDQQWSFGVSAGFADLVHRDLIGGRLRYVDLENDLASCDPARPSCVPLVYDERLGSFELAGHYRRGYAYKQTFTAGAIYSDGSVSPHRETGLPAALRPVFVEQVLPKTRRQIGPFVRYRLSLPRFARFQNLASFGRTETVQVGPRVDALAVSPLVAFGSSENGFRVSGELAYVLAGHDALLDAQVTGGGRLEEGRVVDQHLFARLRGASPAWLLGRLVWQGRISARRRDTSRAFVGLGNDSGLRGFPASYLSGLGAGWLLANLEYRTLPVDIESVHLGAVLFYDAGGLFSHLSDVQVFHSAGIGLRLLIPQLNAYPFRLDFGVPLGDARGFDVRISFGGDQVIRLTPNEDLAAEQRDIRAL